MEGASRGGRESFGGEGKRQSLKPRGCGWTGYLYVNINIVWFFYFL